MVMHPGPCVAVFAQRCGRGRTRPVMWELGFLILHCKGILATLAVAVGALSKFTKAPPTSHHRGVTAEHGDSRR